jgi:gamma-glutamylcyclotransferase
MSMTLYFAYGSNMSRARIEARLGAVGVLGWATLRDHVHSFDKRGGDGSGKGHIAPRRGSVVHGVLYELHRAQLDELDRYESGYWRAVVAVDGRRARCVFTAVHTYVPLARVPRLVPTAEYLGHYLRGIAEHGLPALHSYSVLPPRWPEIVSAGSARVRPQEDLHAYLDRDGAGAGAGRRVQGQEGRG